MKIRINMFKIGDVLSYFRAVENIIRLVSGRTSFSEKKMLYVKNYIIKVINMKTRRGDIYLRKIVQTKLTLQGKQTNFWMPAHSLLETSPSHKSPNQNGKLEKLENQKFSIGWSFCLLCYLLLGVLKIIYLNIRVIHIWKDIPKYFLYFI